MAHLKKKALYSVLDANINRAKEGLRVIEDILRFSGYGKSKTAMIKRLRHAVDTAVKKLPGSYSSLLSARESGKDAGRRIDQKSEFKRKNFKDILISNFKRAEESFRVLEEVAKIESIPAAKLFKELRYTTYKAEKKIILK